MERDSKTELERKSAEALANTDPLAEKLGVEDESTDEPAES